MLAGSFEYDKTRPVDESQSIRNQAEATKLYWEAEEARVRVEKARLALDEDKIDLARKKLDYAWYMAGNGINRIIDYSADVTADYVEQAMNSISRLARLSSDPITLRITSYGGDAISGLALYDFVIALRQKGQVINTIGLGVVASMGGVLLQAGETRTLGPNTHFLIHEVAFGASGKLNDIKDTIKFGESLNARLFGILAERSTLTSDEISQKARRTDWWFTADEAVAMGFADRVDGSALLTKSA